MQLSRTLPASRVSSRAAVTSRPPSRARRCVVRAQEAANATILAGDVSDKDWDSVVLDSKIPVLVDFWAPWCGPCRMIAPIFDELATEFAGKALFVKLNTDESPNTPGKYGVRSIPTVMVFKAGEKQEVIIGAVPKDTLKATINKFL